MTLNDETPQFKDHETTVGLMATSNENHSVTDKNTEIVSMAPCDENLN